jgi:hypothetical protein
MGFSEAENKLMCRKGSGFEENFKQLTAFSEEFLRQVVGEDITE